MYSPGAEWIAFVQGKGGHGDNTAQLFVVDSKGQAPPVELINAPGPAEFGEVTQ